MPKVSVIIVSYNTRDLLRRCLAAIETSCEVIVVDNSSRDGSADMVAQDFPQSKLIRNAFNVGFGAANNQGMDVMTGDLALFLNSDAQPQPQAIKTLAACFEDPEVVAAGGMLLNDDQTIQNSCCNRLTAWAVFCEQFYLEKLLPGSRLFSPYWVTARVPHDRPTEVEQVMGACLMIRPVERFDERFFLYCEDTELCYRLRRHGKVLYEPRAVFIHSLGASSTGTRWESVARYNRGKELFFQLHGSKWQAYACWSSNRKGALFRWLYWSVRRLLRLGRADFLASQQDLFWRVLTAPREGPPRPPDSKPAPPTPARPS